MKAKEALLVVSALLLGALAACAGAAPTPSVEIGTTPTALVAAQTTPLPVSPTPSPSSTATPNAVLSDTPTATEVQPPTATATTTTPPTATPQATATNTSEPTPTASATALPSPIHTPTRILPVASTELLTRYSIVQSKHPQARCNDGTTPVFFYRRGTGAGANKWVIWFKGGGNCVSEGECKSRERGLTSSAPWLRRDLRLMGDDEDRADGILSNVPSNNPDFYNWNHAYLVYCSSDNWAGTRAASPETFNWHFAGHYIVDAMMDALQDENVVGVPNLSHATHILFTGSSAGAAGLRNNIDRLAKQFNWADVRAVSDAGIAPPPDAAREAQLEQLRKAQWNLWNPVYDESCTAANASQPWVCNEGHFLVANDYISTPLFIHMDQLDPLVLDGMGVSVRNRADRPLIERFASMVRDILRNEPGVFSPLNGRHIILANERFYEYKINGLAMFEVLGNWYFKRGGPTVVIEEPRR